jgi:hypothetical protein
MRKNGILSTPQRLVNAVALYVYGALAQSRVFRDYLPKIKRGNSDQQKLAQAIEKDLRWFQRKNLQSVQGVYRAKIKVDLSDLGATYPYKRMEQLNPYIDLEIHTARERGSDTVLASFMSGEVSRKTGVLTRVNRIRLYTPSIILSVNRRGVPENAKEYNQIKDQIKGTLAHELRHFIQNALLDVLSGKKDWSSTDAYEKALNAIGMGAFTDLTRSDYFLQKAEYFPWIGDIFFEVRLGADRKNEDNESRGERPFLLTKESFDQILSYSPLASDFTKFTRKLSSGAPDRYQRYLVEKTAFINDYNEALLTRRQQRRYLTPQRVVSEVLLDLDIENRDLAAWLRKNRAWAETKAKEIL